MNFKKTVAIAVAASALTALAIPAMAETTLYGSARLATFYNIGDNVATGKTSGFDEHLQTNSRFGADFKNGDVGGKVEYGTGVNVRLLYGTWNFGGGTLTVGQDYNSYYLPSAQVHGDDNVNNGYGALWDTRQPQLKVKLNNGVYFAAIQPTGNVSVTAPNAAAAAGGLTNFEAVNGGKASQLIPKLNVGFAGKAGMVGYNVGVVGQMFKTTADKSVTSVLGYAQGTAAIGATSVQGSLSLSQNAGDMGFAGRKLFSASTKDVIGFEGYVQATQKVSDMVSVNAGVGLTGDKVDVTNAKKFDNKILAFVNAPVTLAKNVSVTPEVSYYDMLKDAAGKDEKSKFYAVGAKWQINF